MKAARVADTDRLYELLAKLEHGLGGKRILKTATGRSGWPSHGMYFFFEQGEVRSDGRPRVVRVGTHALTTTSRTILWQRLSQHKGNDSGSNPGGGNHRGSIFRQRVGAALLRRNQAPEELLASWVAKQAHPRLVAGGTGIRASSEPTHQDDAFSMAGGTDPRGPWLS